MQADWCRLLRVESGVEAELVDLAGRSGCKGAGRLARLLLCLASAALWGAVSGAGPPVQHGYAASFQGPTTIAGIRRGVIDWAAPGWRDVSKNVTWATWVRYSRHSDTQLAGPFRSGW